MHCCRPLYHWKPNQINNNGSDKIFKLNYYVTSGLYCWNLEAILCVNLTSQQDSTIDAYNSCIKDTLFIAYHLKNNEPSIVYIRTIYI